MGTGHSAMRRGRKGINLPPKSVEWISHVSSGNFGDVYYGRVVLSEEDKFDAAIKVSKKTSKDAHNRAMFEVEIMRRLKHHNIVRFYGIMQDEANLQIVLEWCAHGSLSSRLHRMPRLGVAHKLRALADVAAGMCYLSASDAAGGQLAVAHNDLAARNCLVDRRAVCKVADFGLAVVLPVREQTAELCKRLSTLPVRWAAPELLAAGNGSFAASFSTASDVWSFGVLVWEVCMDGAKPWGRALGNKEVKQLVTKERVTLLHRMPLPPAKKSVTKMYANAKPTADAAVYVGLAQLAEECMHFAPTERPGWGAIERALHDLSVSFNDGHGDTMSEP